MRSVRIYNALVWTVCCLLQVIRATEYVCTISQDGPVILGGIISFRVDLSTKSGERPSGTFTYTWIDNSIPPHGHETERTHNTTSYWRISYPKEIYPVGTYTVHATVTIHSMRVFNLFSKTAKCETEIQVTALLNGNITITQSNKTLESSYVSSASEAKMMIDVRKGDFDYMKKNATSISTYWVIDCKPFGQTNDLTFVYNFTNVNISHMIEALVIASYEPLQTTTVSPPTTTTVSPPTTTTIATTTLPSNTTTPSTSSSTTTISTTSTPNTTESTTTSTVASTVTIKPIVTSTESLLTIIPEFNMSTLEFGNRSAPYQCLNSSIIPMDPNKTYGYFFRQIDVRAPITNISVEGTNWIQPWDMLSLNVTCKGSGPFTKCLQFHRGKYNITGNETCSGENVLRSCNFSIIHYFLEPSVYTILVILGNDVSKQVHPVVINIYKVTTKPQLSVIVVPVSCTLVAVVLIIFGVSFYIQSRSRFTIEVADFDFGQNNPEMEYKTFTERLRDSFNNAGYKPLSNPQTTH